MKTRTTFSYFMLSFALAGLILVAGNGFAQQKPAAEEKEKKTITIRVTSETDGKVVKIDTTFVTEGEFDEQAFLKQHGVEMKENEMKMVQHEKQMKDQEMQMKQNQKEFQKQVMIVHPDSKAITWTESEGNSTDTIVISDGRVIILNDKSDMPVPPPMPGMHESFRMPHCCPPMNGPQLEHMLQGMLRSMELEDIMPFGELDNIVVKKKNNGKKIIITFDDSDEATQKHQSTDKKQEKVIIYKNGEQGMTPANEEHYVFQGENGEKIIINKEVVTNGSEKTVTVKTEVDNSAPVKQEKKIIIIKESDLK